MVVMEEVVAYSFFGQNKKKQIKNKIRKKQDKRIKCISMITVIL
jgi:hypothetical protein